MKYKALTGKDIANNIRAERNRSDFTQEYVANKLGITLRTYGTYEEDAQNIKATMLYNLASILGCDIDDFYLSKQFTKCEEKQE